VMLRSREALDKCSPPFRRIFSAPAPDAPLVSVSMNVQVRPVILTCSGSWARSELRDNVGHDLVMMSSTVQYKADAAVIRPDSDAMTLSLSFAPTPYSSLIVVSDAMDALTVGTSLLGLISGLASGFRFLVKRWDRIVDSRRGAPTTVIGDVSTNNIVRRPTIKPEPSSQPVTIETEAPNAFAENPMLAAFEASMPARAVFLPVRAQASTRPVERTYDVKLAARRPSGKRNTLLGIKAIEFNQAAVVPGTSMLHSPTLPLHSRRSTLAPKV
jgi:hypothetical protein